jgi:hypothetical protein
MAALRNTVHGYADPGQQAKRWQQVAWVVGSLVLAVALALVERSHLQGHITIGNLDLFGMIERARLLPGDLSAWVSGLYPVGIPLLLRIGLALGLDVASMGRFVSLLGGILCLYGGGLLAWHLTRSRGLALLTMAYLLTTRAILFYSGFEGTDVLAAGLQILALGVLAADPRRRRVVLIAGVINGLAYLIRYTAMVLLLIILAYLLLVALVRRERKGLWNLLLYGLGFLAGALPQIVPSLLVKGDPFYQTQAYHIWLKLYAGSDFVRALQQPSPVEITLWELFWLGPRRLIGNWWQEFSRFWLTLEVPLLDQPLAHLARAGFLFAVLDKQRLRAHHRALLALVIVGITGLLSVFTIDVRFLILLIPVLMVCALYFLWRILPPQLVLGKARLSANLLVLGLLWVPLLAVPWRYAHSREGGPHANVIDTSNMLHAAGASTAGEIVSTNLYHQDVSSLTRDRFTMLYTLKAPSTVDELRQMALESGHHFLIYDASGGLAYHPQYEDLLWPGNRHPGYTPIWASPAWEDEDRRFAAYRIEPDRPTPQVSTQVSLAGGVSLQGYDLTVSADQPDGIGSRVGLYLYWYTTEPVTESLKAFVHLFDAQGNLVAQHDSVPAMWTYDTQDWQPGEVVVDFHWMEVPPDVVPDAHTIAVGLYNAGTGERWPVLDESGQPSGDQIILAQIDISQQPIVE